MVQIPLFATRCDPLDGIRGNNLEVTSLFCGLTVMKFPTSFISPVSIILCFASGFADQSAVDIRGSVLRQMESSPRHAQALRQIRSIPEASLRFRVWDLSELPQNLAAGVDPKEFQKFNPFHSPAIQLVSFHQTSLSEDRRKRIMDPRKVRCVYVLVKGHESEIVATMNHTGTSSLDKTYYGGPPYENKVSAGFVLTLDHADDTVSRFRVLPTGFDAIGLDLEKQPVDTEKVVGAWRSVKFEGSDMGKRFAGIDAEFSESGSVRMIAKIKQRNQVTSITRNGEYKIAKGTLIMTFDGETRSCAAWFQKDRLVVQDPELDSRVHYARKLDSERED